MFLSCMYRLSMHRLIQSLTQFIDTILIPFYPVRERPPYRGFFFYLCVYLKMQNAVIYALISPFACPAFIAIACNVTTGSSFQRDIFDIRP